ncbi:MAG TPA: hypothetical protein VEO55_06395, partial [Candidatus Dormibacteraeota bacterium]|nr:hypothetical protein [Candidatus Dormibacteraeota bacterium]
RPGGVAEPVIMAVAAGAAAAAGAAVDKGTVHEHLEAIHRSSGGDLAADDWGFARRSCRIQAAPGFSITAG